MATIQAQITELEAELVLVKAQMAEASAGSQSFTLGAFSVTKVHYNGLRERRTAIEKSLQRLYRGGRGFVVDASQSDVESASTDATTWINRTA